MIAGADDLVLESLLMGAEGWFAGFPNVFPAASVRLFDLARAGRLAEARELYEPLVAAFRWDSRTEFVQAVKRAMDLVGRYGGPSRPPHHCPGSGSPRWTRTYGAPSTRWRRRTTRPAPNRASLRLPAANPASPRRPGAA